MSVDWEGGGYIRTFTGRKFYPDKPEELDANIIDIAHHLAQENRYGGALERGYSVGHHSLLVEEILRKEHPDSSPRERLTALMHDAEEAYTKDMTKPVKDVLFDFQTLAKKVKRRIFELYELDPITPRIKQIDVNLRIDEMWQLAPWAEEEIDGPYYNISIFPYRESAIKRMFLERFNKLVQEIEIYERQISR